MILYSLVVYNTSRRKVGLGVKLEEWKKMKGNHRRRQYLRDQNPRFSSFTFLFQLYQNLRAEMDSCVL